MERVLRVAEQVAPGGAGGGRKVGAAGAVVGELKGVLTWHVQVKVAVLGAAGGIGQPLSMLLKISPLIGR